MTEERKERWFDGTVVGFRWKNGVLFTCTLIQLSVRWQEGVHGGIFQGKKRRPNFISFARGGY